MTQPTHEQVLAVCSRFAFNGDVTDVRVCGNGHINTTYIITVEGGKRYILQILNTAVFKDPVGVMNNIIAVTNHIRKGLAQAGEDAERGTLNVILTTDGANGYTDGEGRFWRAYDFVEGTVCRLMLDSPETFGRVGEAFGDFQRRLSDFDASQLIESIPNFHNTKKRYADFLDAVERNAAGRADSVRDEIKFITDRADKCSLIVDALECGDLPLRVPITIPNSPTSCWTRPPRRPSASSTWIPSCPAPASTTSATPSARVPPPPPRMSPTWIRYISSPKCSRPTPRASSRARAAR